MLKDNKFIKKILFSINDDHFYKALKITLCTILIFAFFYNKEGFSFALGMILGLSLSSQIDASNSLKDKIFGLGLASLTVPVITLFLTYAYNHAYLFYFIFAFLVFFSALISIYGQRATQFSNMLLLGISLAFLDIANKDNSLSNSVHMFYGGLLYLIVSVIFFLIRPSRYINLELSVSIDNISKYLQLRSQLWQENPNVETIEDKQLAMQVTINESFQKVDQYLEINKSRIINSKNNRKVILASSFINEIMELALSTVFTNDDIKAHINKHPELRNSVQQIGENFAANLALLAESIRLRTKYIPKNNLIQNYVDIQNQVSQIKELDNESQMYLNSILDYLDKQIKKIRGLERVFTENILTLDLTVDPQEVQKYFKTKQYRLKTLRENLSFKSVHFRYSTRLTLAMLVGLLIGNWNDFKHEYWMLSAIVLIMQSGYGLTKSRMNQRIIGTILGGVIGVLILFFVSKNLTLSVLTAIAMLLSFWYSSINYKVGVIFSTMYMILIYGILKTGAEINFLNKILDTLIGALIAFIATNYFWPSWEFLSIKKNLIESVNSAKSYINDFKNIYIQNNNTNNNSLEQSRQNAFIAIGNLMASYQRLVQEPKNKQQNRAELYQIAILNQSLIGAMASLGTFIRSHQNNDNFKAFDKIFNTITYNLNLSLNCYDKSFVIDTNTTICTSADILKIHISQNKKIKALSITNKDQKEMLEASQLVLTQLNWIVNLSEQILKASKAIK